MKQDEQKDPRNGGVISLFLEALKNEEEEEEGGRRLFPPMQSSHCSRGISSTSRSRIILRPPPSSITIFLPAIKGCTYQHSIPVPCVQWKIYPPRRISILSLSLFARETWPKILTRRDQEEERGGERRRVMEGGGAAPSEGGGKKIGARDLIPPGDVLNVW